MRMKIESTKNTFGLAKHLDIISVNRNIAINQYYDGAYKIISL